MRIIDISQEVFSCRVYPGDPAPEKRILASMAEGEGYNLSAFSMCAHNGTHVDAPRHFIADGKTIGEVPLENYVGKCYLARRTGDIGRNEAEEILRLADAAGASERILIAGDITVTEPAAEVFAARGVLLLGNESQSVGPMDAPAAVHRILLGAGTVLLEGIVLDGIGEGVYFLSAPPLNLGELEGAPCRAYLIEQ